MSDALSKIGLVDRATAMATLRDEMRHAARTAALPDNATPPADNPHGHEHTRLLSRALCVSGSPCSERGDVWVREPPGCMGRRGVGLALRFRALACPPFRPPCVLVSIGIGAEWGLEAEALARGCRVYAFDPTANLRDTHVVQAAAMASPERLRFYYLGLGGFGDEESKASSPYGALGGTLRPLDALLDLAGLARPNDNSAIDVLKIDCEGCEYAAFRDLASRRPTLLCRVHHLALELHLFRGALRNVSDLGTLLRHAWDEHGFRVVRAVPNTGWTVAPGARLPASLARLGFKQHLCCYHLQMLRTRPCDSGSRHTTGEEN